MPRTFSPKTLNHRKHPGHSLVFLKRISLRTTTRSIRRDGLRLVLPITWEQEKKYSPVTKKQIQNSGYDEFTERYVFAVAAIERWQWVCQRFGHCNQIAMVSTDAFPGHLQDTAFATIFSVLIFRKGTDNTEIPETHRFYNRQPR